MAGGGVTAETVAAAIHSFRFQFSNEDELQRGVELALLSRFPGLVRREVILTPQDRIDLMVEGVGVECKIAGASRRLAAQLNRYLLLPQVKELVVVSSRHRHLSIPGLDPQGKPVVLVSLLAL